MKKHSANPLSNNPIAIFVLSLLATLFCQSSHAQGQWYIAPPLSEPKWSLELKFGNFEPETLEFKSYFEDDTAGITSLGLAYKILRTVEFGFEFGYLSESGDAALPINNAALDASGQLVIRENGAFATGDTRITAGSYRLKPAHAYLLLRGIWGEDQIAVPYIGAGISRTKYELSLDPATADTFPVLTAGTTLSIPEMSGSVDGKNKRYGLQILLDRADTSASGELEKDYGINNMYLYVEKQTFDAKVNGIDLGGETTYVGLLFEF